MEVIGARPGRVQPAPLVGAKRRKQEDVAREKGIFRSFQQNVPLTLTHIHQIEKRRADAFGMKHRGRVVGARSFEKIARFADGKKYPFCQGINLETALYRTVRTVA